jgi:hypothetical protein
MEFVDRPLVIAFRRGLLVDELNRTDTENLNILLSVLEGASRVCNPISSSIIEGRQRPHRSTPIKSRLQIETDRLWQRFQ